MARIILKCPYLKGGKEKAAHLNNLVKYIATRDGVEKMESSHKLWHSTKKQKDLIAEILRSFLMPRIYLNMRITVKIPTGKCF